MASKRKGVNGGGKGKQRGTRTREIPRNPASTESITAEISGLLENKDFATIEEASAFLSEHLGKRLTAYGRSSPHTPLDKAQDLMYDAWDSGDPQERVAFAELALALSADCADAYSLLADEKAVSPPEAKAYLEEAVLAGRRAVGEHAFDEDVGHFWGILETRPYMRARLRLAQNAMEMGDRPGGIAHMKDMLRLNPGDNQGIRYLLLTTLIEEGDDAGVGELLEAYDDGTASWLYDRALWLFRRENRSAESTAALNDALNSNAYVPAYLTGKKRQPRRPPQLHRGRRWFGSGGVRSWIEGAVGRNSWSAGLASRAAAPP